MIAGGCMTTGLVISAPLLSCPYGISINIGIIDFLDAFEGPYDRILMWLRTRDVGLVVHRSLW